MSQTTERPLQVGDLAPDFTLSAVHADRSISLSDYRDGAGLFLALYRGLYCPFCRRSIAQLAASAEKLKPLGIESLAVVATELENARLYYRFRPVRVTIAVDPELSTHRSYGVPHLEVTPQLMEAMGKARVNPTGELSEPLPLPRAMEELQKLDGYQPTDADQRDVQRQFPQLTGQFMIDRGGTIQWANVEGLDGPAGIGKFPTLEELLAAAERVVST